jgi:phosphoribosylformylglycinamidine (FGAM) synthase-like enzyme
VTSAAADLAHAGVPVLHDVSHGGVALAVAEICITSGVGAAVEADYAAGLFDESPHRFLAVLPDDFALELDVPHRRIGTIGGGVIDFAGHGSVPLEKAARTWRDALPRRLGH